MAAIPLKRLLLGRALASHRLEHQLLPKVLALPVFSSDPLSSNAYATEEMMLVLVLAGSAALAYRIPLALVIATVLIIVIISYRQTIRAYPSGGGSYIVAHENLGELPGLIAAAALLVDYVLTVSVSVVAGVLAITSAAPELVEHKVALSLGFVVLLTLANLRGVKEAGTLFAIPTYGFVTMIYVMLVTGFVRCLGGCPLAETSNLPLEATAGITLFLILRAFSSGATALTGVEAISNGVQAFRRPQSRNAASTLGSMGFMTVTMFIGITVLSVLLHVRVNEEIAATRSVLSQIAETVFGRTFPFFALQALTAGILVLAANTSYQDFPRLSAILARDRFMPSQFRNRGNRLVFSNGIIVLSVVAGILIVLFDASLTNLIKLYVVGVFTAFTLSQAGMVRRWYRLREPGWRRSMIINAIGATSTGLVLVIVAVTKFGRPPEPGAWIVVAAMPVIIGFFVAVSRHYRSVGRALRDAPRETPRTEARLVVLVPDLGLATVEAVAYLRAIRPNHVIPLHIGPPDAFEQTAQGWESLAPRIGGLQPLPLGRKGVVGALRAYLRSIRREDEFLTVVVPEELSGSMWQMLTGRTRFWLKLSLLFEQGIVVTNVPLLPEERTLASAHSERPLEPVRSMVLVPVSAVHAATARAVEFAQSLHPSEIEAVYFSTDPGEERRIFKEWVDWGMSVPLSVIDAPFRDLTGGMLEEVRRHTSRAGTIVTVVLPELVVKRWWENLFHNQNALSLKRLLVFEPRVVVTSVPFRLR